MLIDSDRITPGDRDLWSEWEAADTVTDIGKLEAAAVSSLMRFKMRDVFCGVSWGKDSVCVAHLCCLAGGIPLYWVRTPRENPDCVRVRDAFLRTHYCEYHEIDQGDRDWPHWGYGLREIPHDFAVHGVRQDESGQRRLSAAVHGVQTRKFLRPILRWTGRHVFAYLKQRGLPVHPAYAMTGGGRWDRNRIRVGTLGGVRGTGHGRAEWEREYYGDVLRRLESGPSR